jgi:hypothetical protein
MITAIAIIAVGAIGALGLWKSSVIAFSPSTPAIPSALASAESALGAAV